MKKVDLNLLVIFDTIMREGAITRAAERLAMTQPAVSNAVSRMRIAWNDPLFVKQGRGIVPTPHAQAMWDQLRSHLDHMRAIANPEPFDATSAQRTFRIGAADINVALLWPGLRKRVENQAPGISFHAVPNSEAITKAQLINAEVDAVISGPLSNVSGGSIRSEALLESNLVCAMRNDHPLADEPLSLSSFTAADHLLTSLSGDATGMVDELLQARGLSRRVAMTVNHFSLIARLLRESDLICTVPYEAIAEEACRGELRVIQPPLDIPPVTLSLLWHQRSDRNADQQWLRDQIRAVAQEARESLPPPTFGKPVPRQ